MEEAKLPSGGTLTNILKNMESCGFIRKYNSLSLRKTQALGISGIDSEEYTWRKDSNETGGAQIDLLIDRKDNTINLCEMKFCESVYELREDEEMKLINPAHDDYFFWRCKRQAFRYCSKSGDIG